MLFKKIKIKGFKSFLDSTTIDVSSDITCIVGPNGGGKSNVVDAIRWVLGEQSIKSLRGESSMSEVIFSGTKEKKTANLASVSLTFENISNISDLPSEIEITRKIYRTGENEYFLNNKKCRLKDINDIFLKTGISKGSYNIISQGEISEFINLSPREKRFIFEDAASVLKYKTRKEEALRKLKRSEENLLRLGDLIGELEKSLIPLEESSKKAKIYKELSSKLEELTLEVLSFNLTSAKEEKKELEKELKILDEKLLLSEKKINQYETNILTIKQELDGLQDLETKLRNDLITKEQELADLNLKKMMEKNLTIDEERLHQLKFEINSLKTRETSLDEESKNLGYQVQEVEKFFQKNQSLMKEFDEALKEKLTLRFKLEASLSTLEKESKTYNPASKRLINANIPGVLNIVGEELITDSIYKNAYDVVLGNARNNIIVESSISAKAGINYLKENNLGRLTFLPLSKIKNRSLNEEDIYISKGYLGVFSNFVECSSKFLNIKEFYFGSVLLYSDLDSALKGDERYRRVTLEGDILNKSGTITGGSFKNNFKEELRLQKGIKQVSTDILTIENRLKSLKCEQDGIQEKFFKYKGRLVSIKEEKETIETSINELSRKLSLYKEEPTNDILDSLFTKKEEREEIIRNLKVFEGKRNHLNEEYDTCEAKRLEFRKSLKETNDLLSKKRMQLVKLDLRMDADLNELNKFQMSYEYLVENYFLKNDIKETTEEIKKLKTKLYQIGPVSIDVIKETERLRTRFDFLIKEEEDMLETKTKLINVISSLDEVMKKEFLKTFEEVNLEFSRVFKKMFNGGEASLILTDPDNLLETGIEIKAMPVGKKLSSINLLSGGEKTLTAISLIFALLNITPTPFCVFDEVEAALDEVNGERFAKYLENYQESQFIIVTHKQKTMEFADTLYGVTMEEEGVSKLVSLELN